LRLCAEHDDKHQGNKDDNATANHGELLTDTGA
jgi:hypothetical protein